MTTENTGGDGLLLEEEGVERAGFILQRKTQGRIIPFLYNTFLLSLLFVDTVTRREINFTLRYLTTC